MGILLVYDITDEKSFGNIRNWIRNIEQHASSDVNKMLIGNKCDLDDKRVVEFEKGKALADEFGIKFAETSAKSAAGVEKAFISLAEDIKKRLIDTNSEKSASSIEREESGNIKIGATPTAGDAGKKKGCCAK
eukprot:TRINITY_DN51695_c0_g2_i1.p1 TRINITY_DN51695_c0_g2~~TRINITY_DN51695_c0_g2_i1.p1  ORF type:complete len:133 (-),score=25.16 TRINITY_DN51695_c0_g2_i1:60-458(-)